jgi:SIR2-like domain
MAAATHDPRREVVKIREHLGSHDGLLAFLAGAGTSAAVFGTDKSPLIPTISKLSNACREAVAALGDEHAGAFEEIVSQCENALKAAAPPDTDVRNVNVEDVLSAVRTKLSAIGDGDRISGLDRVKLEAVEQEIRTTIATAALPDAARIPERLPHHDLARWISRLGKATAIEIFTTNYDTLFERALEDQRLSVFDGFVGVRRPFFSALTLSRPKSMPGPAWTRLWKLHGSINWTMESFADDSKRIVRASESGGGELIFPSLHKYDESRKQPYVAMLDHLSRVLDNPSGALLVVLGYSFGDQHINEIIFDALDSRDRAHVFAFQFEELSDKHPLIVRAKALPNLLVYGPKTAVLGGVRLPWRLSEPVEDRTAALLDIAFDSNAVPDTEEVALEGEFRLGNFKYFASFLGSLVGEHDE